MTSHERVRSHDAGRHRVARACRERATRDRVRRRTMGSVWQSAGGEQQVSLDGKHSNTECVPKRDPDVNTTRDVTHLNEGDEQRRAELLLEDDAVVRALVAAGDERREEDE